MDNMDTPAAEDRHDASRRALLRDALAGERPADVVARLRDRVDGHARAGTPREHADDGFMRRANFLGDRRLLDLVGIMILNVIFSM